MLPFSYYARPLMLEVMKDPARVCTGQVYERAEITQWLRCNSTPCCPNTKKLTLFE